MRPWHTRWLSCIEALWYPPKQSPQSACTNNLGRVVAHLCLAPLSLLYALIMTVRRAAYQSGILKVWSHHKPVVVVGNLTVGGTGKTPVVMALTKALQTAPTPLNVGIVSRGYGGDNSKAKLVDAVDPTLYGDEPSLFKQQLGKRVPICIGRDRVAAVKLLCQTHPEVDVIISDDGWQHLRLGRCFNLCVIDGTRQLGNQWCLPLGPLREPKQALKHADSVLILHSQTSEQVAFKGKVAKDAVFSAPYEPSLTVKSLDGETEYALTDFSKVTALCGIGNPKRFFEQLSLQGLAVTQAAFPDHHHYCLDDIQSLPAQPIITTEKDAIKLAGLRLDNCYVQSLTLSLPPQLITRIIKAISSLG